MATLASFLFGYRYFLFVAFIICNAIICSITVWNMSLDGSSGHNMQLDAYLVFLGALGVVFIIPTVATDILRDNALVNRVWFECLWVGIFWVMELAGASAITASLSSMVCDPSNKDACTSASVLIVFTWICTMLLMIYLLALTVSAVMHQGDASNVWNSGVRTYPWYSTRGNLTSAPSSPVRQFQKKPLTLNAAHPQVPVRQATMGRDLEYGLERGARADPTYQPSRPAPRIPNQPASNLYPAVLQSSLPPHPYASEPSTRQALIVANLAVSSSADAVPPRPTHPRKNSNGSGSKQRPIPPPLDLTRISAFKTIDDRVSRR
ncbi:hypothetical protein BDY19DRAFT_989103 [Irpex rosettiformis]|uniref:Uncharacterized protein n=1 Tax=Irpex rosettiformis TaxID=378272 RepID=A0ACB8UGZ6_9APHY|nr:hypothetical protein BDY19DRAFT_989103 [Irpex rosettiformis]